MRYVGKNRRNRKCKGSEVHVYLIHSRKEGQLLQDNTKWQMMPLLIRELEWKAAVDSAPASGAEVMGRVATPARAEAVEQGRGQGVDPCHQAGPPCQGYEDQVPGGDLSLLPAHQGI